MRPFLNSLQPSKATGDNLPANLQLSRNVYLDTVSPVQQCLVHTSHVKVAERPRQSIHDLTDRGRLSSITHIDNIVKPCLP